MEEMEKRWLQTGSVAAVAEIVPAEPSPPEMI
jgi:hypothetical protein